MAGVSFPVKRPVGRALIVGAPSGRAQSVAAMQALGFTCAEIDDPYAALAELCKRPLVYRALVLSLSSLYREELSAISTIKRRFPHVDVWLTHIESRQASLAEAMRHGADGLLADDGLHRTGAAPEAETVAHAPHPSVHIEHASAAASEHGGAHDMDEELSAGEPVLTAEELRALLQEQPLSPPEDEA